MKPVPRPRLRPLNEPRPIRVQADDHHTPLAVALDSRAQRLQAVEAIRERWRIDDEWWRRRISRLYFSVVLESGQLMTLYHDLEDGRWFVQG